MNRLSPGLKLGLITGPLLDCSFVLPFLPTRRLKLSREQHATVRETLEQRRERQLDGEAGEA